MHKRNGSTDFSDPTKNLCYNDGKQYVIMMPFGTKNECLCIPVPHNTDITILVSQNTMGAQSTHHDHCDAKQIRSTATQCIQLLKIEDNSAQASDIHTQLH